ncbi:MAG TPA: radical SAM family heme chaperone HemW [Stellaceae bacterium]|jgi:oxygen-independent coproporphyrinogen-3 oxidase
MATPLALYIHWPFCKSKCPYCDFNSHVRERIDEARWRAALLAELDHWAPALRGRELVSIFFGGGTPSLMAPATAAALIERAAQHWPLVRAVEITLEANPTSVEASRFEALRDAGVNRVSLGVQALEDAALKFLGRGHNAGEARDAVALAARLFPRFSFDLIYARPDQTPAAWRDELRRALAMAGDHLSLYQLTIEPGTAFATAFARGDFRLPDDETQGALYEETQEALATAGLPAYEISNHARPGEECRHNLAYWRYRDYLGIGPGAHGRLALANEKGGGEKRALKNFRAPETWLAAVERAGQGVEEATVLALPERRDEMLMMGLRLKEGVARAAFRAETGLVLEAALDPARLKNLCDSGFLMLDDAGLRASDAGRQRLNAVLAALLA